MWCVTVVSFTRAQIGDSHVSLTSQVALVIKNLPASAGDVTDKISSPGWGRSPGGGHVLLPPVLSPGESQGRRATVHRVAQSRTRLNDLACMCLYIIIQAAN